MVSKRKKVRGSTGELEMLQAIRERAKTVGRSKNRMLALGIGDDCAILRPFRGEELVVTTDLSLERVHFRRDWHPPESVGHRCLARGLSDLAAMGARPEGAFLSLAIPHELSGRWAERFFDGLLSLAKRYDVPLAGGDLAQAAPCNQRIKKSRAAGSLVVADIVLLGSAPTGKALLRSGARAGDTIYVTGSLGGSAAELRTLAHRQGLLRKTTNFASHPHLFPQPRVEVGRRLVHARLATAAIDVSDGLSTDLTHLCEESGLSAVIHAGDLPVDATATLDDALHGGEDYELLFTAKAGTRIPSKVRGVALHAIGHMVKRRPGWRIQIKMPDGKRLPLVARGWQHFRS